MGHIIVLFSILAVVISISGTYSAIQIFKAYRIPLLRNYIYYLASWSVLTLINLVTMYVSVNISADTDSGSITLLWKIITLIEIIVYVLIFYSISHVINRLLGKGYPQVLKLSAGFSLAGLLITVVLFAGLIINEIAFKSIGFYTLKAFQILLILSGIILLFHSSGSEPANKHTALRKFSLFLIIAYSCLFFSFLLTTKESLLITGILFITINLLQTIPIKSILIGFYGEMPLAKDYKEVFNEILLPYNISEREKEIIEMIIHGKSNKEIEQNLFISSHTVKNHIYNIFQKTGVKSRNQLICLILNNKP